jgi:hypothetical protein
MSANRGISHALAKETKDGKKKKHSAFQRKDRRPMQMIIKIHKARMVNTGRRDRNTHVEIKK